MSAAEHRQIGWVPDPIFERGQSVSDKHEARATAKEYNPAISG